MTLCAVCWHQAGPRGFSWRATFDASGRAQAPIGPVSAITAANDPADGGVIAVEDFELDDGEVRTVICAPLFRNQIVDLSFDAGFGASWAETPADLRRAAKMLAAHHYDQRHTAGGDARETLYGVAALIQPWRPLRLTIGAGA